MNKPTRPSRSRQRTATTVVLCLMLGLVVPEIALAHGLGGVTTLPVPGWLFLVGGGTVLVVSFVALGVLWHEPKLNRSGQPMPAFLETVFRARVLGSLLQACSAVLLIVVWSAAAFGPDRVILNIAPTWVYVIFWVGVPIVVVLFGDVWRVLDPWRAIADGVAWVARLVGVRRAVTAYPDRLGVWPAVAGLSAFIVLELIWKDPASPTTLALGILVYSMYTWAGMLRYGRSPWSQSGDGFAVYFEMLSRIAFFGIEEVDGRSRLVRRRALSALTRIDRRPGAVVFVAVMLGSVAFDGLSRSSWWQDRIFDYSGLFNDPTDVEWQVMALNFALLVLTVAVVAFVYTLAVRQAGRIAGPSVDFQGVFVGSLIPIAFVYVLAHYVSYLLVQGQFAIPLLSDPYGQGWDLFGTIDFQPNIGILSPNATWLTQVTALVVGHVAGLVVAHDRAVALVDSPKLATRTQLAMLVLMVFYTVGGMWLLSLT